MYAAAEGNSTLGIPKKVGKEFVQASKGENIKELPKKAKGFSKLKEKLKGK